MASITTPQDPSPPTDIDAKEPLWKRHHPGHHWPDAEVEFEAAKIGMWLFLATEVLLFAGMFCAYALFRMQHPEAFVNGSHYLDWRFGFINTCILLISSFTVAWSVRCVQRNQQALLKINLFITIVCGIAFLAIKFIFEYYPKWSVGKRPGSLFTYPFAQDPYEPLWWAVYYGSTALHAFHVFVGICLLIWILLRSMKGHYGPKHYTGVENIGLYWHLIDLIWIFLFPLLYLIH